MRLLVTEEEKKHILSKHSKPQPKSVKEIEKEIGELELKLGRKKTEPKEDIFDDLVDSDIDLEMDRDSLEQD